MAQNSAKTALFSVFFGTTPIRMEYDNTTTKAKNGEKERLDNNVEYKIMKSTSKHMLLAFQRGRGAIASPKITINGRQCHKTGQNATKAALQHKQPSYRHKKHKTFTGNMRNAFVSPDTK